MAGHSHAKNIMYRKGIQDKKRGKVFTKIIREISVAVKEGGAESDSNPRLRAALYQARDVNMPKDTVERAIKKAQGGADAGHYETILYEGYGSSGVAFLVLCLTDNRHRTGSEVRSYFTKHGGTLGEPNSVAFLFDHVGVFIYALGMHSFNDFFETALALGATDVAEEDNFVVITVLPMDFARVRDGLDTAFGLPQSAQLLYKPKVETPILDKDTAKTLMKLIDVLEDNDDVQQVFTTMHLDDALLNSLDS